MLCISSRRWSLLWLCWSSGAAISSESFSTTRRRPIETFHSGTWTKVPVLYTSVDPPHRCHRPHTTLPALRPVIRHRLSSNQMSPVTQPRPSDAASPATTAAGSTSASRRPPISSLLRRSGTTEQQPAQVWLTTTVSRFRSLLEAYNLTEISALCLIPVLHSLNLFIADCCWFKASGMYVKCSYCICSDVRPWPWRSWPWLWPWGLWPC